MNNIIPQEYNVTQNCRGTIKGHRPLVIWFSGLSGSGKSTLANLVEKDLHKKGIHTYSLDGDNIRGGLNSNLGFSEADRTENLRRIAEVSKLFIDSGTLIIAAFISPLKTDRELIKKIIGKENFIGIFVNTSIEECERRDVKGLYKKARAGEIKDFTGINAPYEKPFDFDVVINTEETGLEESVNKIVNYIQPKLRLNSNE
ncbi:adenylyl-sulfate kinase [Autumnicola psychrophila]|uniref:Adenylyl-sulfate kinase n=1 Tax=Autumnicola psychrophila TaxID=3075592 RepID=A0ABU3DNJ5_9FLAO|nr:adenylyl-sulfate kinase [Zunongwangia sp. F225]MDT0685276.1 adenylyl-sulfate kinase [Zunongwangia sp. F225]